MGVATGSVRVPGWFTRLRRRHGLVRSQLCRRTDRIEAAAAVVALLLALLLVPVALTVGGEHYQRGLADAARTAAERSPVSATLVEPPRRGHSLSRGGQEPPAPATAQARWSGPDGQPRLGRLSVAPGQRPGDQVRIWVDRGGQRVTAPRTPADVLAAAVVFGADLAAVGWLLLGLGWWAACRVLGRVNALRWELEWSRAANYRFRQ